VRNVASTLTQFIFFFKDLLDRMDRTHDRRLWTRRGSTPGGVHRSLADHICRIDIQLKPQAQGYQFTSFSRFLHGRKIREQLLTGTYEPKPVRRRTRPAFLAFESPVLASCGICAHTISKRRLFRRVNAWLSVEIEEQTEVYAPYGTPILIVK